MANPKGRGGFGENPQNRFKPKSYHEEAKAGWTSEMRLCLVKLNEITFDTFMYLCFKWGISGQETLLTNKIQEEIDEMFSQVDCDVNHPTNLVDSCARMVLNSKSDPKVFNQILEHIEGRAMQRSETKTLTASVSIEEYQAMQQQLEDSKSKINELLLGDDMTDLPELEIIDAEIINIGDGEAKPLEVKSTEEELRQAEEG